MGRYQKCRVEKVAFGSTDRLVSPAKGLRVVRTQDPASSTVRIQVCAFCAGGLTPSSRQTTDIAIVLVATERHLEEG